MRHRPGVSQETVDALKAMSLEELSLYCTQRRAIIGFPEPLLRDLLDGITDVMSSRIDRLCPCGAPVDITGRTYEMVCWRCFLDKKADNQTRRRKRAS